MKYNNSSKSVLLPVLIALALATGILIGVYLPRKNPVSQQSSFQGEK